MESTHTGCVYCGSDEVTEVWEVVGEFHGTPYREPNARCAACKREYEEAKWCNECEKKLDACTCGRCKECGELPEDCACVCGDCGQAVLRCECQAVAT